MEIKWIHQSEAPLRLYGVWGENQKQELVSYWAAAQLEIGFTGSILLIDAGIQGDIQVSLDGERTQPVICYGMMNIKAAPGSHSLHITVHSPSRLALRAMGVEGTEQLLELPKRPYIHFIGDSITHNYPGFSYRTGEALGCAYSIVAYCGISLVDGWGWYEPPKDVKERPGMESMYFRREFPHEGPPYTEYSFSRLQHPDWIVQFLGTNDYLNNEAHRRSGHIERYAEHAQCFVQKITKHFPHAHWFIMKALTDRCCRNEAIVSAFERICASGISAELIPADTWEVEISEDGTHPTPRGYEHLAKQITKYLCCRGLKQVSAERFSAHPLYHRLE